MNLEFKLAFTRSEKKRKKRYKESFSLSARGQWDGNLHVLSGPSGAGKTTFLNLIAGTLAPQQGELRLNGQSLIDTNKSHVLKPKDRRIGYVFQDDLLFPHLTVQKNVEYGWDGKAPTLESLRPLSIHALLARKPHQLSGGESRRVSIARALMRRPELLLLDEPFTGLNETLKAALKTMLLQLSEEHGFAMLIVTHDYDFVMSMPKAQHHQLEAGKLL